MYKYTKDCPKRPLKIWGKIYLIFRSTIIVLQPHCCQPTIKGKSTRSCWTWNRKERIPQRRAFMFGVFRTLDQLKKTWLNTSMCMERSQISSWTKTRYISHHLDHHFVLQNHCWTLNYNHGTVFSIGSKNNTLKVTF